MKTNLLLKITFPLAALILTAGVYAQEEKSEVQVKIIKDGQVIKDTTYMVEDEASTKMAVRMLDMTLGEKSPAKAKKVYAFTTENGKTQEWTSEEGEVHVIENEKYIFHGDGDKDHITIVVDEAGNKTIQKEVIVIEGEDDKEVKEVKEIILIEKEKSRKGEAPEVEWIEKGDRKVLIIDDGGKEKTIKVMRGEGESSTQTFVTEDGKKVIIRELKEGDVKKEVEVEVNIDDEKVVAPEKKTEKKKKKGNR